MTRGQNWDGSNFVFVAGIPWGNWPAVIRETMRVANPVREGLPECAAGQGVDSAGWLLCGRQGGVPGESRMRGRSCLMCSGNSTVWDAPRGAAPPTPQCDTDRSVIRVTLIPILPREWKMLTTRWRLRQTLHAGCTLSEREGRVFRICTSTLQRGNNRQPDAKRPTVIP
jgi:hypothetical protein